MTGDSACSPGQPAPGAGARTRAARGSVRGGERALTPDLARGLMLLMIVLSNTGFHLWAADPGPSAFNPVGPTAIDRVVQFLKIVTLDLRSFPVFAFLFGYGMMRLYLRQRDAGAGERAASGLLRRRSLWLIVFGLAHATLLMGADILGAYGVMSLLLGWLVLRRADTTLLVCGGVLVAAMLAMNGYTVLTAGTAQSGGPASPELAGPGTAQPDVLAAAGERLESGLFVTFVGGSPLSAQMYVCALLGFWAARRRILEEPGRHRRLLRRSAGAGLALCWLGALPLALAHLGVLDVPPGLLAEGGLLTAIHDVSGIGGVGYVAVFGLLAHRMSARLRGSVPVLAVAAAGKRSLSVYLTHSLIFAPVLAAWGLGLGARLGSASMAVFAIAVWLVTVAGAYALERAGRGGPAEVVLRRLVYGPARR